MPKAVKKEEKYKMTVWVQESIYHELNEARVSYAKKNRKPIRPSEYIESEILKPFLAKAKASGILK